MRKSRKLRPRASASMPVGATAGALRAAASVSPRARASFRGMIRAMKIVRRVRSTMVADGAHRCTWRMIAGRANRAAIRKKAMPALRFPVAVVVEKIPLANRCASEKWQIGAVERDDSPLEVAVKLSDDATGTRWRFTGFGVELHASECEGYFLNITAPEP